MVGTFGGGCWRLPRQPPAPRQQPEPSHAGALHEPGDG